MGFGVGEPWVVPISQILLNEYYTQGIGVPGWEHMVNEVDRLPDGAHPHK